MADEVGLDDVKVIMNEVENYHSSVVGVKLKKKKKC